MSLKRKIRITGLNRTEDEKERSVDATLLDSNETTRSSATTEDPFAFPGSSTDASNSGTPLKIPRLVLKFGSPKKGSGSLADPLELSATASRASPPVRTPPHDAVFPGEERAKTGSEFGEKKKRGRKRKTPADDVNINDVLLHMDDSPGSRSGSLPSLPPTSSSLVAGPPESAGMTLPPLALTESLPPPGSQPVRLVTARDPFETLLEYYLSYLDRKDDKKFFAFPITDLMAPNYSLLIKHPMDFSTMRKKLARGWYENLSQFRNDFDLVCSNAMTYNAPETIYYRAAKKLSRLGKKLMSKDRLPYAKRSVAGIDSIPPEMLRFDAPPALTTRQLPQALIAAQSAPPPSEGEAGDIIMAEPLPEETLDSCDRDESVSPVRSPSKFRTGSLCGPYETIPQENAEEILEQLKKAGKEVADRLAQRKPNLIMPKRMPDGSIALNILNPDNKSTLTIGALAGPLKIGSDRLPNFDQRPKMDAVTVPSREPAQDGDFNGCRSNLFREIAKLQVSWVEFPDVGLWKIVLTATGILLLNVDVWFSSSKVYEKYYKDYGAFSSHAPKYDSKGFIFTKDEVDMLRTAYGSDRGIAYAESLMRWGQQVRHPVVKRSIEKLLNDASGGEHSDVVYMLNERVGHRAEEDRARLQNTMAPAVPQDVPPLDGADQAAAEKFEQLKSLTDDGIDMSFLDCISPDYVKPVSSARTETESETLLSLNGELLHQLYLEQTKRLATSSTAHLGNIPLPGETECSLAEEAIVNLSKLMAMAEPKDVVPAEGVRKSLNIDIKPVFDSFTV